MDGSGLVFDLEAAAKQRRHGSSALAQSWFPLDLLGFLAYIQFDSLDSSAELPSLCRSPACTLDPWLGLLALHRSRTYKAFSSGLATTTSKHFLMTLTTTSTCLILLAFSVQETYAYYCAGDDCRVRDGGPRQALIAGVIVGMSGSDTASVEKHSLICLRFATAALVTHVLLWGYLRRRRGMRFRCHRVPDAPGRQFGFLYFPTVEERIKRVPSDMAERGVGLDASTRGVWPADQADRRSSSAATLPRYEKTAKPGSRVNSIEEPIMAPPPAYHMSR